MSNHLEFVIQEADETYFDLALVDFREALHPNTIDYDVVPDKGEHCIKVQDCEIIFFDEMAGIQVIFNCDNFDVDIAEIIVQEICKNIEDVTGQKAVYIQMPNDLPYQFF